MKVAMIPIDKIRPSPFQPRDTFDKEKIKELGTSIKTVDLLSPIIVRKDGDTYQIIAGERRWRAWHGIGRKEIPVIMRVADDVRARELSLIENWHREDLSSTEKENMVDALWKSGKYKTRGELAERLGVSRTTLENILKAKERRDGLSLAASISTRTITDTRGLEEGVAKKLIDKLERGEIQEQKVREYARTIKKAPEPVKKALLKRKSKITPERAEKIIDYFPEEEQQKEIIKEIEQATELEERGIEAFMEDRRDIVEGKREPEITVRDSDKKLMERYEEIYSEVITISAEHVEDMRPSLKNKTVDYMRRAHAHLERELKKLGEIKEIGG